MVSHLQLGLSGSKELLFSLRVLVCMCSGEGNQQDGVVYSYPELRFLIGLHSMHLFSPACGHYVANNKAMDVVGLGCGCGGFPSAPTLNKGVAGLWSHCCGEASDYLLVPR